MDPIDSIKPGKDTTLALMLEAQSRGWQLACLTLDDLYLENSRAKGYFNYVKVFNDPVHWFEFTAKEDGFLGSLDVILMRKDPPFDLEYIMATYILEQAEREGTLVVNRPGALRDANEKVFTSWFPQCCPASMVTRSKNAIRQFLGENKKIVIKPTNKMGGQSVFVIAENDPNTNVIIEEVTKSETRYAQIQSYIPEIETVGDKRILLINGVPVDYGIARMPQNGDHRGNMAAGGLPVGFQLNERDRWICTELAPVLREKGLFFVGIDIIGDYLTEINVTSPTGIREIDKIFGLNISAIFFDHLLQLLQKKEITISPDKNDFHKT